LALAARVPVAALPPVAGFSVAEKTARLAAARVAIAHLS
jgi:hypothetical protein